MGDVFLALWGGAAVVATTGFASAWIERGLVGRGTGALCPVQAVAGQPEEGPPHLLAGQSVDDGVHGGVEHRQHNEPLGLEQDSALLCFAGNIHEEEDEERGPAGNEHAHHDHDGPQKGHGSLRVLGAGHPAAAGLYQAVDARV